MNTNGYYTKPQKRKKQEKVIAIIRKIIKKHFAKSTSKSQKEPTIEGSNGIKVNYNLPDRVLELSKQLHSDEELCPDCGYPKTWMATSNETVVSCMNCDWSKRTIRKSGRKIVVENSEYNSKSENLSRKTCKGDIE